MLNLLWSVVYHKNCHLVSRNPHIRATPLLIWKIHSKTHQQQRDEEIVKVLQQDCSKLCTSEDSFFYPAISKVPLLRLFLHYLLCTFPSLNPFSFYVVAPFVYVWSSVLRCRHFVSLKHWKWTKWISFVRYDSVIWENLIKMIFLSIAHIWTKSTTMVS